MSRRHRLHVALALFALCVLVVAVLWASERPAGSDPSPAQDHPLPCIRHYESRGNYRAVSHSGRHRGAYQFDQRTWDSNAAAGPHTDWVGVRPDRAPVDIQDSQARVLVHRRGLSPWPTPSRRCR